MKTSRMNWMKFVGVWGGISVLVSFVFTWGVIFIEYFFKVEINKAGAEEHSFLFKLVIGCLFAPIVETYFFQKLIYDLFSRRGWSEILMIVFSSSLFGIMHLYSIAYAMATVLIGILLIYAYIIWDEERRISKYLIVTMIHAFHNTFFLLLELTFS